MRLLFDKLGKGAEELKEITGSYYANNDFKKIKSEILDKTEKIIKLIGTGVYTLAENYYHQPPAEANLQLQNLTQHVQLAIAYGATFDFFRMNIVSHEDSGRKLKLNAANEKMPWEWMLDRDDEIHQRKANNAVDRLIAFLDASNFEAWKNSEAQKATKELFVNTTELFNRIYSIDGSGYFFHLLKPIMGEVQRTQIMPALGTAKYKELLEFHQNSDNSESSDNSDDELLLILVQQAIPLLTILLAVDRLSISVMPYGLVQKFQSERQGRNASLIAPDEAIRKFTIKLERSATRAFDIMKKQLNASFNYDDYPLLPENNEDQKFFRT